MRTLILFSIMLSVSSVCFAQSSDEVVTGSDESLAITERDAEARHQEIDNHVSSLIDSKKDSDKIKVEDVKPILLGYADLIDYWEQAYQDLNNAYEAINGDAQKFASLQSLLTDDVSVFTSVLPDISNVPQSLKGHYLLIQEVINISENIADIESRASKASETLLDNPKEIIQNQFFSAMDTQSDRITEILRTNLPTFGEKQKAYVVGLQSKCDEFFNKYSDNE